MLWQINPNLEYLNEDQTETSLNVLGVDIFVSWTDNREGINSIFTQKYDLDGNTPWTKDYKVSITSNSVIQEMSNIVINSSGNPIIVWQDQRNTDYDIYATEFNDPGIFTPIPGVEIRVWGDKLISATPVVYEYDQNHTSNTSGEVDIMVEYDPIGYQIEVVTPTLNTVMTSPPQPITILPNENKDIIFYVE